MLLLTLTAQHSFGESLDEVWSAVQDARESGPPGGGARERVFAARVVSIEPQTIIKDIHNPLVAMSNLDYHEIAAPAASMVGEDDGVPLGKKILSLEKEMKAAARALEFEQAAVLRDRLRELQELQILKG